VPPEDYTLLTEKLATYQKELAAAEKILGELAKEKQQLDSFIRQLVKRRKFWEVFYGMNDQGKFALLQGYCPVPEVERLVSFVKQQGFGYLIEQPDNQEETPTYIKNPRWISIVNPVFRLMNTLPGYQEFDISLVFLAFFSVFFAMLIGDAGYGFIFLGITCLAKLKLKKMPGQLVALLCLLSITTIIWGTITGTWFGCEQIGKIPFLNQLVIREIDSFIDSNQDFMIYFCFLIGIIQLSIAHLMRFFRLINSLRALSQLGWLGIMWGLFFLASALIVNKPFPPFAGYLFVGGIVLALLFTNPQKNIFKGILSSLADLPLTVISSFSDIVSYLRLFAVGYASVTIASSFNGMAASVGFGHILSGFIAAAILFMGHALNITLGLMAVIVHGIRLNMLEFAGHLNMQWSGKKYQPFTESEN